MPRARISAEDKRRIIDAHNNGEDYEETARVLGIARGTAWSIISRHQRTGVIARPRGGRRNVKVDQEMSQQRVQIVEERPEFTLNQIKRDLELALPMKPRISISTISKMLHGQFYRSKYTLLISYTSSYLHKFLSL